MADGTNVTRPNEADTTPTTVHESERNDLGEIQRYLDGLTYPISKQTLIATIRDRGAGSDVISLLDRLPDEVFRSYVALEADLHRAKRLAH